jgi:hypothetical protein
MKCPGCDLLMEVKRFERRNCIRVEHTCPFCKYRDFDFEDIQAMRTGDAGEISKSTFMPSNPHKGNLPKTKEQKARANQRKKLWRLAKRYE